MSFCQNSFFNKTPSCICSMFLHCEDKVSNGYVQCVYIVKTKYHIAESKVVVGVDWPMYDKGTIYAYRKALLGNHCLSSHNCYFIQKNVVFNQTPTCICSMCLHYIGKVSNCSFKRCGRS